MNDHKRVKVDDLMSQGQVREITSSIPGKSGIVLVLALFFHLSLQTLGHSHSYENYFSE